MQAANHAFASNMLVERRDFDWFGIIYKIEKPKKKARATQCHGPAFRSVSSAPRTGHEGQALEQVYVLFIFQQGAVQFRQGAGAVALDVFR